MPVEPLEPRDPDQVVLGPVDHDHLRSRVEIRDKLLEVLLHVKGRRWPVLVPDDILTVIRYPRPGKVPRPLIHPVDHPGADTLQARRVIGRRRMVDDLDAWISTDLVPGQAEPRLEVHFVLMPECFIEVLISPEWPWSDHGLGDALHGESRPHGSAIDHPTESDAPENFDIGPTANRGRPTVGKDHPQFMITIKEAGQRLVPSPRQRDGIIITISHVFGLCPGENDIHGPSVADLARHGLDVHAVLVFVLYPGAERLNSLLLDLVWMLIDHNQAPPVRRHGCRQGVDHLLKAFRLPVGGDSDIKAPAIRHVASSLSALSLTATYSTVFTACTSTRNLGVRANSKGSP